MAGTPSRIIPCIQPAVNNTLMNTSAVLNNTFNGTIPEENCTGRTPIMPGKPRPQGPVCNVCQVHCALSAASLVFLVGVVTNFLVIYLVLKDKSLHKATFVAIAGLSLADMLFLSINLVMSVEELLVIFQCVQIVTDTEYFRGVMSILWKNATFNVVFLAVVRYIILAHPFKARQILTNKRICLSIASIIILAIGYHGLNRFVSYMGQDITDIQRTQRIVNWCLSYVLPLCCTAILHILKVVAVRLSVRVGMNTSVSNVSNRATSRNQITNMARVIMIVLAAELLLPLPRFILFIFNEWTEIQCPNESTEHAIKGMAYLLYLLNFSINPFIYAFKSPQFQKSLRNEFGKRRPKPSSATGPTAAIRIVSSPVMS